MWLLALRAILVPRFASGLKVHINSGQCTGTSVAYIEFPAPAAPEGGADAAAPVAAYAASVAASALHYLNVYQEQYAAVYKFADYAADGTSTQIAVAMQKETELYLE